MTYLLFGAARDTCTHKQVESLSQATKHAHMYKQTKKTSRTHTPKTNTERKPTTSNGTQCTGTGIPPTINQLLLQRTPISIYALLAWAERAGTEQRMTVRQHGNALFHCEMWCAAVSKRFFFPKSKSASLRPPLPNELQKSKRAAPVRSRVVDSSLFQSSLAFLERCRCTTPLPHTHPNSVAAV